MTGVARLYVCGYGAGDDQPYNIMSRACTTQTAFFRGLIVERPRPPWSCVLALACFARQRRRRRRLCQYNIILLCYVTQTSFGCPPPPSLPSGVAPTHARATVIYCLFKTARRPCLCRLCVHCVVFPVKQRPRTRYNDTGTPHACDSR